MAEMRESLDDVVEDKQFCQLLKRVRFEDPAIDSLDLRELLKGIQPAVSSGLVEPFSHVLIRLDVDVPIVNGRVADPVRLESGLPTLRHCLQKMCRIIIIGHIGRDSSETLEPVATCLSELLEQEVTFLSDWFNEATGRVDASTADFVKRMPPGSIVLLENCRKYSLERDLWTTTPQEICNISEKLKTAAASIRETLAKVQINEAIAASNADFSSCVVPLQMDQAGLGFFIHRELATHAVQALDSNLVVISGLKINKLDDLESIVSRKPLRTIISAGSLAMALKKAEAEERGDHFSIGLAEKDESSKAFISRDRVAQARYILDVCRRNQTEVLLPIDFVLDNGVISSDIPDNRVQLDIGPATVNLFDQALSKYAAESEVQDTPFTMFTNGVFGKFEDSKFEAGTRQYVDILKKISGHVRIFVGGGEGRLALERYASIAVVEHAFTAGGTILKCMGGKHVAYLKALWLQAQDTTP